MNHKIFERTEGGVTTHVSVREGLAEVNTAMMEGKRNVRRMSSGRTRHDIEYNDGRKVIMTLVDAPAVYQEPEEWGTATVSTLLHRFQGADYRAKCNKGIRWYRRRLSETEGARLRTRSEIESGKYAHLYTFCRKCEAK